MHLPVHNCMQLSFDRVALNESAELIKQCEFSLHTAILWKCSQRSFGPQNTKLVHFPSLFFSPLIDVSMQEKLPGHPLSGMFNKRGDKVRLTFKLEVDQLWLGTKGENMTNGCMHTVQNCIANPLEKLLEWSWMGFWFTFSIQILHLTLTLS